MEIASLGYIWVESPDAGAWETFGPDVLGLALSDDVSGDTGAVSLTNDDRPGRLVIFEGPRNQLNRIGWELPGSGDLVRAARSLQAAGVVVEWGTPEECRAVRVRELIRFTDPAGFTHELFYGQLVEPGTFRAGRAMSGFVTGDQGFGHVVLFVPDLATSLDFYCDVMGFRVSDEIDFHGGRLMFLHVNPRHHSLAIAATPGMRGVHHLMLQVGEMDDVGTAYDLCQDRNIPISMTLGRHTNDEMFSFYVRSPSGFDIEYGWGAKAIDDAQHVVTHMSDTSVWGHRPGENAPAPGCIEPIDTESQA